MKKSYTSLFVGSMFPFLILMTILTPLPSSSVLAFSEDIFEESGSAPLLSQESSGNLLLAKKGKEKYGCLEVCAKTRYQCETGNRGKNKVGTKNNWQESGKCETKYRTCLDRCEVD